MLEYGQVLKTWALMDDPLEAADQPAERLADHRLAYLDYEGPLSEGRGDVTRVEQGTCEVIKDDVTGWVLHLIGERLVGRLTISAGESSTCRWEFEPSDESS